MPTQNPITKYLLNLFKQGRLTKEEIVYIRGYIDGYIDGIRDANTAKEEERQNVPENKKRPRRRAPISIDERKTIRVYSVAKNIIEQVLVNRGRVPSTSETIILMNEILAQRPKDLEQFIDLVKTKLKSEKPSSYIFAYKPLAKKAKSLKPADLTETDWFTAWILAWAKKKYPEIFDEVMREYNIYI